MQHNIGLMAVLVLLSGCGAAPATYAPVSTPAPISGPAPATGQTSRPDSTPAPIPSASAQTSSITGSGGFKRPPIQNDPALSDIVGKSAETLTAQLGKSRIDLSEGDARKLQFAGETCVLDIFLYPLQAGGEPVATHVEARERQSGAETDKAGCIAEIDANSR